MPVTKTSSLEASRLTTDGVCKVTPPSDCQPVHALPFQPLRHNPRSVPITKASAWPAVQEATRANFHPETIGICAALLAGWAGLRGRTVLCWLLALVALGAKEDQAWNLLVVGLVVAVVPARRALGRRLAVFAAVRSDGQIRRRLP